jgi:16S rRNA G1207 methylase RsmC
MTPTGGPSASAFNDYTTPVHLELRLNGQEVAVITKPGLADWRGVSPAATLLAEHASFAPQDKALLLGSGHGVSGQPGSTVERGELWVMDTSAIALEMTAATLETNDIRNARLTWEINLPESENGSFDTAAIELPKGRRLAQRWLAQAWAALRPGGALYLAGANALGVQSTLKDAEGLFGPGTILDYKKGNRVARFTRPDGRLPGRHGCKRRHHPGKLARIRPEDPHQSAAGLLAGCVSYDRLDEGYSPAAGSTAFHRPIG